MNPRGSFVLTACASALLAPRLADACTDAGLCAIETRPAPSAPAIVGGRLFTQCTYAVSAFSPTADGGAEVPIERLPNALVALDLSGLPRGSTTIDLVNAGAVFDTLQVDLTGTASTGPTLDGPPSATAMSTPGDGLCIPAGATVRVWAPTTSGDPIGAWLVADSEDGGVGRLRGAALATDPDSGPAAAYVFETEPGQPCYVVRGLGLSGQDTPWSAPICALVNPPPVPDAGPSPDAGGPDAAATDASTLGGDSSGCTCAAPSTGAAGLSWLLGLGLGLGLGRRRRRA